MPVELVSALDLNKNELQNARVQNLASAPSGPVEGQFYFNTTSNVLSVYAAGAWRTLYDGRTALNNVTVASGNVDLNTQKIIGLADPTNPTDAANKQYVDNLIQGLNLKSSVRVATTTAGTLASSFANGQTVDGVTLVTGDRILIKDQATGSENGIYTVNASGAPTRALDANSSAELRSAFCFVEEGTANANTGWVQNADNITLNTTALVFIKFSASASSGPAKFTGTITGNSSATSFAITHNLGTKDVTVNIRGTAGTYNEQQVQAEITHTSTNAFNVVFGIAPATGDNFSVTVIG